MNLRTFHEDGRSKVTLMANQIQIDLSGLVDFVTSKTEELDKMIAIHQESVENYHHKPVILTHTDVFERLKEHWIRMNELMVTKGNACYENQERTICRMTLKGAYTTALRIFRTKPKMEPQNRNTYSTEEKTVRFLCKIMLIGGGMGVVAYLMFADGVYAAIGAPIALIGAAGLTSKPTAKKQIGQNVSKPTR